MEIKYYNRRCSYREVTTVSTNSVPGTGDETRYIFIVLFVSSLVLLATGLCCLLVFALRFTDFYGLYTCVCHRLPSSDTVPHVWYRSLKGLFPSLPPLYFLLCIFISVFVGNSEIHFYCVAVSSCSVKSFKKKQFLSVSVISGSLHSLCRWSFSSATILSSAWKALVSILYSRSASESVQPFKTKAAFVLYLKEFFPPW